MLTYYPMMLVSCPANPGLLLANFWRNLDVYRGIRKLRALRV